ncbi:flavodoxin family protein [Methanolobus sp.]|uniref:flavodoxin family protein n=1 Tax=Methanolobus sp. TaxID=1874737 RepID=UPI0026010876|nr:flavodoxin family protein [Methanolobus sp.]
MIAMKVVGFVGSPRKNGNTDVLVQQVLDGAMEAGAEVEKVYINDMNLRGCQGCDYCRTVDGCKIKDDMTKAYDALKNADGFVFGSPIYFFQFTGQMRLFIDRCFALLNPDFSSRLIPGKKAVIVGAHGAPEAGVFNGVYDEFSKTLGMLGMDVKGTFIDAGHHVPGGVKEEGKLMEAAKESGARLFE